MNNAKAAKSRIFHRVLLFSFEQPPSSSVIAFSMHVDPLRVLMAGLLRAWRCFFLGSWNDVRPTCLSKEVFV